MLATHPMPDPSLARPSESSKRPWITSPRSPSWERPSAPTEPLDPSPDVIHEAIEAALEALADAQAFGSTEDVEAAEERLARYQRVVVRYARKEDDHLDDDLTDPIDDWSDVTWLDEEDDSHGA